MTWIADAGTWAAIIVTGLLAGTLLSRWNSRPVGSPRLVEAGLLASAAAGVVAWCANAGSLLGPDSSNGLLAAYVPIQVPTGIRLALLWATLPGAALTFGATLLVWCSLSGTSGANRLRQVGVTSALSFVALGLAAWFAPLVGAVATAIPPFAQSTSAATAPLLALIAIILLAAVACLTSARSPGDSHPPRTLLLLAWLASTLAIALEQVARSQLGIGPRDPIVFGSASSGLVLWLVTSALLHPRVQSILGRRQALYTGGGRGATRAAHAGALCVAVSFALHAFATRATVSLPPGASVTVQDAFRRPWQLVNQGVSRFDVDGADVTAVAIETRNPRGRIELVTPEIREYHGREGQHLQNTIVLRKSTGGPAQSLRLLLSPPDSLDVASVRVTFLPVPILWNAGVLLLAVSAILALSSSASSNRSPAT